MHAEMYLNQMSGVQEKAELLLGCLKEYAGHANPALAVQQDAAIAGIMAAEAMFCILDKEFTILAASSGFASHIFQQAPEIIGKPIATFLPPDIGSERLIRARLVLSRGVPEHFYDFSAGVFIHFGYIPVYSPAGLPVFLLVVLEEVNETGKIASHFVTAEAKYKEVFANSRVCTVVLTEQGHIIRVNPAFVAAFEVNPVTVAGTPLLAYLHREDAESFRASLAEAVSGNTPKALFGMRFRSTPGNIMRCSFTLTPLPAAGGPVQEVLAEITDETPLWQARETIAWNKFLLEQLPDAIVATDSSYHVTSWNKSAELMYGWTADEAAGRHVDELFRGKFLNTTRKAYNDAIRLSGAWKGDAQHYHKSGTPLYINLSISVITNEKGDVQEVIALHRDVTVTRKLQSEVQTRAAEWETTFNAVEDSIMLLGTDKQILRVNRATLSLLNKRAEEVNGTYCSGHGFCASIPPEQCPFARMLVSGRRELAEVRFEGKWFEVSVDPVFTAGGAIGEAVHILRDISRYKEAEERLRRQGAELEQLNSVKDRFISVLAHDLRSPFNGIYNLSDLLYTDFNILSPSERLSFIKSLRDETGRVYTLLENLLEWGRFQQGRMEFTPAITNIYDAAQHAVDLLKGNALIKNISLHLLGDHTCMASADERMLNSIFRNLISNAIKFTQRNGVVEVLVSSGQGKAVVTVKDTGVGITTEGLQKIFRADSMHSEPGTEREKGSGLGLVLAREFVECHGGNIRVTSAPAAGSVFTVTIPQHI